MRVKSGALASRALASAPVIFRDAIGVSGLIMVVHGVAAIHRPSGWIVAGLIVVAMTFLSAQRSGAR